MADDRANFTVEGALYFFTDCPACKGSTVLIMSLMTQLLPSLALHMSLPSSLTLCQSPACQSCLPGPSEHY